MRVNFRVKLVFICLLCSAFSGLNAIVKLPHIFSDNMVLQREKPIKIWGWADKGEAVEVCFNGQKKKIKADKQGNWIIYFDKVSIGKSYTIEIKGKDNQLSIKDILIGDVWLCSGQSNMEMPIRGWSSVLNYQDEIDNAEHPLIRAFNVDKSMSGQSESDFNGTWKVCSPQTVADFSATAYFFARKLNRELNIPIGIINSSWGGTEIETWISDDAYTKLPTQFGDKYKDIEISDFEQFVRDNETNKNSYQKAMNADPGTTEKWFMPSTDVSSWGSMQIPQFWEKDLGNIDGIVWFRYNLTLPNDDECKNASIQLGTIDDNDVVWINGVKVGETEGYAANRLYNIPQGVLRAGENAIVVKVVDNSGGGGIYGNADDLYIKTAKTKYPISGEWLYKVAVSSAEFNYVNISPNMHNSLLYNAMINPIIQLPIKGAIWYQGESNVSQAYNYNELFKTMISDWRKKWGFEFPFYWVQLANHLSKDKIPQESEWAELREAQSMTLSLPKTGQAVITDIGEENDIHPRNKQDVGLRLALIALNKTYGKNVVCSGPTFKSMNIESNKIIIDFDNIDGGLQVNNKYGYIEGFAIAGADKKYEWAKAYLEGDKVVVVSDHITNPVSVRYSWSDNPDVNLFNGNGLPAAPFRTDFENKK